MIDLQALQETRREMLDAIHRAIENEGLNTVSKRTGINPGTLHRVKNESKWFTIDTIAEYYRRIHEHQ